jgi:hypothetical protein
MVVLWVVVSCSILPVRQRFGETSPPSSELKVSEPKPITPIHIIPSFSLLRENQKPTLHHTSQNYEISLTELWSGWYPTRTETWKCIHKEPFQWPILHHVSKVLDLGINTPNSAILPSMGACLKLVFRNTVKYLLRIMLNRKEIINRL